MNAVQSIATTSFVLLKADGSRSVITVVVGRPYAVDEVEARCPIALDGLGAKYPDIAGIDTFQALCLAVQFARRRLEDQLDQGHVLTDPTGRQRYAKADLGAIFGATDPD